MCTADLIRNTAIMNIKIDVITPLIWYHHASPTRLGSKLWWLNEAIFLICIFVRTSSVFRRPANVVEEHKTRATLVWLGLLLAILGCEYVVQLLEIF